MHSPHMPDFEIPQSIFRNNLNAPAELFFANLKKVIETYEAQLDERHQLIWEIACLNGKEYQVDRVGYINPSLLRFTAIDPTGGPCELLIHVTSVQFVLRVEEVGCEGRKRTIGFR